MLCKCVIANHIQVHFDTPRIIYIMRSKRRGANVEEQTSRSKRRGENVEEQTSRSKRRGAHIRKPKRGGYLLTTVVDEPTSKYGQSGYSIAWNEGTTEDKFNAICTDGLQPQSWPWVHGQAPYRPNFKIKDLLPLRPGRFRVVFVVKDDECYVMNSERNVQFRNQYDTMEAGMLPLSDHFQLCDRIDKFREENQGKNTFVSTNRGEQIIARDWGVKPYTPFTDTSFRCHSEVHVSYVTPRQFLLAYYRPVNNQENIVIWKHSSQGGGRRYSRLLRRGVNQSQRRSYRRHERKSLQRSRA